MRLSFLLSLENEDGTWGGPFFLLILGVESWDARRRCFLPADAVHLSTCCPSAALPSLQHGWDVNSAVEWYLESGGVGHGVVGAAPPFGGGGGGGAGAGGGDDWGAIGWEDVGADAGAAPAHGEAAADAAAAPIMRPPDDMEEVDDVIVEEDPQPAAAAAVGAGARSARGRVASRPMPAAARPRSNPIDVRQGCVGAFQNDGCRCPAFYY